MQCRYLQEVVNTTELALTVVNQGNAYTKNLSLLNLMSGKNKESRLDGLLKSLMYVAPVEFKARNGSKALDVLKSYVMGTAPSFITLFINSIESRRLSHWIIYEIQGNLTSSEALSSTLSVDLLSTMIPSLSSDGNVS